jgi:hypothetical protein
MLFTSSVVLELRPRPRHLSYSDSRGLAPSPHFAILYAPKLPVPVNRNSAASLNAP